MTKAQIRTRIQQRLDRTDSTFNTLVDTWLAEVIKTVEDSYPLEYTKKSQTAPLVADSGVYTLPSDLIFHHPWTFRLQSVASPITYSPLVRIHDRSFHLWVDSPSDPTGTSEYYILEGGTDGLNFRVYPVPDVARTLEITGGYYYTDVAAWIDGTTNWLTTKYPNLIVEAIAAIAFEHYGESNAADRAFRLYNAYLNGDEKQGVSGMIPNERRRERKGRMIRMKTLDDFPVAIARKLRRLAY